MHVLKEETKKIWELNGLRPEASTEPCRLPWVAMPCAICCCSPAGGSASRLHEIQDRVRPGARRQRVQYCGALSAIATAPFRPRWWWDVPLFPRDSRQDNPCYFLVGSCRSLHLDNYIFFLYQINTSQQPPTSQQYCSLIINQQQSPATKQWTLCVLVLRLVGFILYLFFSKNNIREISACRNLTYFFCLYYRRI